MYGNNGKKRWERRKVGFLQQNPNQEQYTVREIQIHRAGSLQLTQFAFTATTCHQLGTVQPS